MDNNILVHTVRVDIMDYYIQSVIQYELLSTVIPRVRNLDSIHCKNKIVKITHLLVVQLQGFNN